MPRVCDNCCSIIHEAAQLGIQAGILNREAVFHMSHNFAHDLERRGLVREDKNADFGTKTGLD
jgi:hypothetical protein